MELALDVSVTNHWITGVLVLLGVFAFFGLLGFIAFRWADGLWGAIILAFNLLFATLITLNYFEPLAKLLAKSLPIGLFYWDGVVFVVMILLLLFIFNLITNRLSRVNVQFPKAVENSAKPLLLLFIALIQILPLIYLYSHIGPLSPKPIAGTVKYEERTKPTDPETILMVMALTASRNSLCPLNGDNHDAFKAFYEKEYNRRCALFMSLWDKRSSMYKGETGFLDK